MASTDQPIADRRDWPVIVIGGGPSGLASSQQLKQRGIEHVVLERGEQVGATWRQLYDSLRLHSGRHLSVLPGMAFPRSVPLFPSRRDVIDYLERYAAHFALPVRTGIDVTAITREGDSWRVATTAGPFTAAALIVATGIVASPRVPEFPGQELFGGRLLHSSAYHRPGDVSGQKVLVVGVGNSGGEIAAELAKAGRDVDVAVRSGANVVPLTLFGVPIQYLGYVLLKLPKPLRDGIAEIVRRGIELRRGPSPLPRPAFGPLDEIPIIGFNLVDAIKGGRIKVRPGIARLEADGVVFTDGTRSGYDAILLATGYQAAIEPLGPLARRDHHGNALRRDRIASADQPALFFVGHNHDTSGGINNIARDARLAAEAVAGVLAAGEGSRFDQQAIAVK